MIKAIEIENFKCIGERQRIELAPITLLFGANSAGKSTLIQALIYAHEILVNLNPNTNSTSLGGEAVQLGGFSSVVHNRDMSLPIRIRFEVDTGDEFAESREDFIFEGDYCSAYMLFLGVHSVEMCIVSDVDSGVLFVQSYKVGLDGVWLCDVSSEMNPSLKIVSRVTRINWIHPNFLFEKEKLKRSVRALNATRARRGKKPIEISDFHHDPSIRGDYRRSVLTSRGGPLDIKDLDFSEIKKVSEFYSTFKGSLCRSLGFGHGGNTDIGVTFDDSARNLGIPRRNCSVEFVEGQWLGFDEKDDADLLASNTLKEILLQAVGRVRFDLTTMVFLGPIRRMPPREYSLQQAQYKLTEDWATGFSAWERLLDCSDDEFTTVSDWIGRPDRLDTGYVLKKILFTKLKWDRDAAKEMSGARLYRQIARSMEAVDVIEGNAQVVLVDVKSKLELEIHDVGTGISQVLPVVVAAVGSAGRIVCIEQPELHMHPRVQVRLGDLFISQVARGAGSASSSLVDGEPLLTGRPQFLLETHSEHLLLRIMRRMRQTVLGQQKDPRLSLEPDDVSVIYVEPTDSGTAFRPMPLNDRGELVKAWPGGFFEEGLEELL